MASQNKIDVVISATDRVSRTVDAINKKLESFQAPMVRLQRSLSRFADLSGLTKVGNSLGAIGRNAYDAFQKVGQLIGPLGAITGAASLAGLARMVTLWGEWGTRIGFAAQCINLPVQQLQELQNAGRLAGASAQSVTAGLQTLGQVMYDAIGGRAPEATAMFNALGISFRDATGHARNVAEVLPEVADKIASIKDPYTQAQVAQALFGSSAEEMLPFLRRGAAGIAELREQAQRYGTLTEAQVKQLDQLRIANTAVTLSVENLGQTIAADLAPVLAPMLLMLADWISQHKDQIAGFFKDVATHIKEWIEGGGIQRTVADLKEFGAHIDSIVSSFGGWKVAIEALGVAWLANSPIAKMTLELGKLLTVIGRVPVWALRLLGISGAAQAGLATTLLIPGDTANNQEANSARERVVAQQTQHYYHDHPEADPTQNGDQPNQHTPSPTKPGPTGERSWFKRFVADPYNWFFHGVPPGGDIPRSQPHPGGGGAGGGATSSTFNTTMPPEARGLLDTIASTESPGYDREYNNKRFTDFSHHPNEPQTIMTGPNRGMTSTAAGRYQFLYSTWEEARKALNLPDFSPESQDKAAWWLAQRNYHARTGRDLAADLQSSDPAVRAAIGRELRGTWTSLPGGIEAGTTTNRFVSELERNIQREQARGRRIQVATQASGPPMVLDRAGGGLSDADVQAAMNARLRVSIDHNNAPPGVSLRTSSDDSRVTVESVRIRRAMESDALV